MTLHYQELWGHYRATRAFQSPHHLGSSLRGSFGWALRQASAEAYEAIFTPTNPSRGTANPHLFQGQAQPRPWVIVVPPPGNNQHRPGDVLSLGLRLFGNVFERHRRAVEAALADVGHRLPQRPSPSNWGFAGSRPALTLVNVTGPYRGVISVQSATEAAERVVIDFITPTRLRLKGAPDGHPSFAKLLEMIALRVARLSTLYGDAAPAPSLSLAGTSEIRLTQTRLHKYTWYSSANAGRSKRKIQGQLGSLTYSGPVGPYSHLLRAAEAVHLGSDSTYGLGRVRVSVQ